MLRRDFVRRLAAGAAGLLVADDALELVAERRIFPSAWPSEHTVRRLSHYDGREVFARHYVQRFLNRRNRTGALTVAPPSFEPDRPFTMAELERLIGEIYRDTVEPFLTMSAPTFGGRSG